MQLKNLQILVVEDNPGDFVLIEEYLAEGMERPKIQHAQTFEKAKQLLKEKAVFNVILLDLALPDLSGKLLVQRMLEISGKIPVIVLTGYENQGFGLETLSMGVADYLLKDEISPFILGKIIAYSIERSKINQAIKESEKKYRDIFDSIDEGFCIMEKVNTKPDKPSDYRYMEINPAFEWQSGMPDPVGKTICEIVPDVDPNWIENYDYVMETGEPLRFEIKIVNPERILSVYAFKTGAPQEQKLAVLFNDISEQKRAEKALAAEADALNYLQILNKQLLSATSITDALEEVMTAAVTLVDADSGSVQVYKDDEVLIPVATHGLSDKQVKLFERVTRESATPCGIALVRNKRVILEDVETDPDFKDHRALAKKLGYRAALATPLFGRSGKLIAMLTTHFRQPHRPSDREMRILDLYIRQAVDIIERIQAEEKLEAVNETLEERVEERTAALLAYQEQLRSLASQLSKAEENERHRLAADLHDNLGQLLAMCKMELDLLEGEFSDGTHLNQVSDLVGQAITYTRELMSELKPPPSLDEEDIAASLEWVARKMKKHGLEVTISNDEKLKPLDDEIRSALLQSAREVLFNVVKHAQVKTAQLNVSRTNGEVLVSVIDKGKGFDPKRKKLTISTEGGFGLFTIKERMDLLGGEVKVHSAPGKGTKVNIYAPLLYKDAKQRTSKHDGSSRQAELAYQESGRIRVLLVDDHQMMLKGLRKIIEQQDDLKVIAEATNGREAVKLARETLPDVIVMDVDMPIMNGIDATREIISSLENVRVIGLSLHEKGSVAQAMRNAGASAYLTKTEAFEALSATIRSEAVLAKK